MQVDVTWQKGLSFTGAAESGFSLPLGASSSVGGTEDGFRPLELMALSLAGCTGMDVISILLKKRQAITAFTVNVQANQATEYPKVLTRAVITYDVTGRGVDEAALVRAIELSEKQYCPAQAMLGKILPIELKYELYEDEENGNRRLIKRSTYSREDRG
jgi:putative redox protein